MRLLPLSGFKATPIQQNKYISFGTNGEDGSGVPANDLDAALAKARQSSDEFASAVNPSVIPAAPEIVPQESPIKGLGHEVNHPKPHVTATLTSELKLDKPPVVGEEIQQILGKLVQEAGSDTKRTLRGEPAGARMPKLLSQLQEAARRETERVLAELIPSKESATDETTPNRIKRRKRKPVLNPVATKPASTPKEVKPMGWEQKLEQLLRKARSESAKLKASLRRPL